MPSDSGSATRNTTSDAGTSYRRIGRNVAVGTDIFPQPTRRSALVGTPVCRIGLLLSNVPWFR